MEHSHCPCLITKLSSFRGGDTSNTRIISSGKSSFKVRIREEQSRDREMWHTGETVSYLAISSD